MYSVKIGLCRLVKLTGATCIAAAFALLLSSPNEFELMRYCGFVTGLLGGTGLMRLKLGSAASSLPAA